MRDVKRGRKGGKEEERMKGNIKDEKKGEGSEDVKGKRKVAV